MSLKDCVIKTEYRSLIDNVITEFYIPLLSEAKIYKRAVGFFSSTALIEISKGISNLVLNGGKICIVASPHLSDEDVMAIKKGYDERDKIIENALLRQITTKPVDYYSLERLNLLAHLISDNILDIKIAYMEKDGIIGMYHEKMGIIEDFEGNKVAFSGSMNESATAMSANYETIDVFCNWKQSEVERVTLKEKAFTSIWNNNEQNIKVVEFPKLSKLIIEKYKKKTVDFKIDDKEYINLKDVNRDEKIDIQIPKDISLYSYQKEAINNWKLNNYCGIFDMATGTGKTYTALAAIENIYNNFNRNIAVIIVCPYQHLVEQWVVDIKKFGVNPIICYSASQQKNWKDNVKISIKNYNLNLLNFFCIVTTNATFSSKFLQKQIKYLKGNILLVIDEAHNFGAKNLNRALLDNIPYRLALSATLERHGDIEGTERLYAYFGKKCIEYTLKEAINNNMLTPYYYYPIVITLDESELSSYIELTKKLVTSINQHRSKDKKYIKLSDYEKMLLIKRARLVAGAKNKLIELKKIMLDYKNNNHILVYCGATTINDFDYDENTIDAEEVRQIDAVTNILGNTLDMKVCQFTSKETIKDRENIKKAFEDGDFIQALVAIRCLDEGVNIPSIETAFILASSTNPKEYIQRRGRVLRKFKGKKFAKIYDFITLPISLEEVNIYSNDIVNNVKGLVKREIIRMQDFNNLSENPYINDELIYDILASYDIRLNEEEVDKNVI